MQGRLNYTYSDWHQKFIFLWKISGRWIFCRFIWERDRMIWALKGGTPMLVLQYDYAFNDFELIQKSAVQ